MSAQVKFEKCSNSLQELSKLLSQKLWADETIKDRFVLCGLADAIHIASLELDDLADRLPDPDDNDRASEQEAQK